MCSYQYWFGSICHYQFEIIPKQILEIGLLKTYRNIKFQTSGSDRWLLQTTTTAESGSNAGSNFVLVSVADNGLTQNTVLSVSRATQAVDLGAYNLTVNGVSVGRRDALGISEIDNFDITATEDAELLAIEIPMN